MFNGRDTKKSVTKAKPGTAKEKKVLGKGEKQNRQVWKSPGPQARQEALAVARDREKAQKKRKDFARGGERRGLRRAGVDAEKRYQKITRSLKRTMGNVRGRKKGRSRGGSWKALTCTLRGGSILPESEKTAST